jgi:hypothetical protein
MCAKRQSLFAPPDNLLGADTGPTDWFLNRRPAKRRDSIVRVCLRRTLDGERKTV